MMQLPVWSDRVPEKANNLNPAFCGALVCQFVHAYTKQNGSEAPFPLIFCALPLALHSKNRDRLPRTIRTSLFSWVEANPDVRIGFAERAKSLAPYVMEGIHCAATCRALSLSKGGKIGIGEHPIPFTPRALTTATSDVRKIVMSTRLIGRWFAISGDVATIFAVWGIRL